MKRKNLDIKINNKNFIIFNINYYNLNFKERNLNNLVL